VEGHSGMMNVMRTLVFARPTMIESGKQQGLDNDSE
jgi:hypothetical protein